MTSPAALAFDAAKIRHDAACDAAAAFRESPAFLAGDEAAEEEHDALVTYAAEAWEALVAAADASYRDAHARGAW